MKITNNNNNNNRRMILPIDQKEKEGNEVAITVHPATTSPCTIS